MTQVRRAVRMSEEAWRAIKVAAATEGVTMGEWIEQVLAERRFYERGKEVGREWVRLHPPEPQ